MKMSKLWYIYKKDNQLYNVVRNHKTILILQLILLNIKSIFKWILRFYLLYLLTFEQKHLTW